MYHVAFCTTTCPVRLLQSYHVFIFRVSKWPVLSCFPSHQEASCVACHSSCSVVLLPSHVISAGCRLLPPAPAIPLARSSDTVAGDTFTLSESKTCALTITAGTGPPWSSMRPCLPAHIYIYIGIEARHCPTRTDTRRTLIIVHVRGRISSFICCSCEAGAVPVHERDRQNEKRRARRWRRTSEGTEEEQQQGGLSSYTYINAAGGTPPQLGWTREVA